MLLIRTAALALAGATALTGCLPASADDGGLGVIFCTPGTLQVQIPQWSGQEPIEPPSNTAQTMYWNADIQYWNVSQWVHYRYLSDPDVIGGLETYYFDPSIFGRSTEPDTGAAWRPGTVNLPVTPGYTWRVLNTIWADGVVWRQDWAQIYETVNGDLPGVYTCTA